LLEVNSMEIEKNLYLEQHQPQMKMKDIVAGKIGEDTVVEDTVVRENIGEDIVVGDIDGEDIVG